MVPANASLPDIRQVLANEADNERNGDPREDDLALLCCVRLFSRGQLEDVLRIWAAKRSGFDLGCSLDVQFLCGAGLEETKRFLEIQTFREANQALKYIQKCEAAGDFVNFTPEVYLDIYRRYFGVA